MVVWERKVLCAGRVHRVMACRCTEAVVQHSQGYVWWLFMGGWGTSGWWESLEAVIASTGGQGACSCSGNEMICWIGFGQPVQETGRPVG